MTKLLAEFLWLGISVYVQVVRPQRNCGEVRRGWPPSHHSLVYLITIRGTGVTMGHNGFRTMWNCPLSLGSNWYVATSSQSLNEINNGRLKELWQHGHKLIQSAIFSCETKYRLVVSNVRCWKHYSQINRDWWRVLPIKRMFITQTDSFVLSLNQFELV